MDTVLRSRSSTVTIGSGQPFAIIGERINPTGRKLFAQELRDGELSRVAADASSQVADGADVSEVPEHSEDIQQPDDCRHDGNDIQNLLPRFCHWQIGVDQVHQQADDR